MKKLITLGMMALSLAACSNSLTVENHTYDSYGLLNEEKKSDKVCYETNVGDIVLGVLFFETIIVPIYTFGFDYKEPKRVVDKNGNC